MKYMVSTQGNLQHAHSPYQCILINKPIASANIAHACMLISLKNASTSNGTNSMSTTTLSTSNDAECSPGEKISVTT